MLAETETLIAERQAMKDTAELLSEFEGHKFKSKPLREFFEGLKDGSIELVEDEVEIYRQQTAKARNMLHREAALDSIRESREPKKPGGEEKAASVAGLSFLTNPDILGMAQGETGEGEKTETPEAKLDQLHLPLGRIHTDMCRTTFFLPFKKMAGDVMRGRVFETTWGHVSYTGEVLTTNEQDVLICLLHVLQNSEYRSIIKVELPPSKKGAKPSSVPTYAYSGPVRPFLKAMGVKSCNGDTYNRFLEALKRLATGSFTLEANSKGRVDHILRGLNWDEDDKTLSFTLDPFFYNLYFKGMTTLIDLEEYLALRSNFSKHLYLFVVSHSRDKNSFNFGKLASALNLDKSDYPVYRQKDLLKRAIKELIEKRVLTRRTLFSRGGVILERSTSVKRRLEKIEREKRQILSEKEP